jgi:hypothetical protein
MVLILPTLACDHPALIDHDYKEDKEAFEPMPAKNPDGGEDGDDLAQMFGQLEVGAAKCKVCQIQCVLLHHVPLIFVTYGLL